MARDADTVFSDPRRLDHDPRTALTVICGQTQLLERQLRHGTDVSLQDRARLLAGLGVILTAAREVSSWLADLPEIWERHEPSPARERHSSR